MAIPATGYFPMTGDPVIDATTHGYRWVLDATRTVDWSVSNGFGGESWANQQVVAQHADAMLATYSYYADIRFNFVGLYATPATAFASGSELNLWLSGNFAIFPSNQIWARAYFPEPALDFIYPGQDGDVILNINSLANFLPSYAPGSAGWFVFMHELGHALGLKHPHDDGGTGRPTLEQIGLGVFDQDWATIMSYEDSYDWNLRSWDPATPMILDVLALQYLYGRNMATNAGDDIYDVSSHGAYTTIWDASGSDIASAFFSPAGMLVQLPEYQLSSLVPTRAGFAMRLDEFFANDTPTTLAWLAGDIEGAVGSSWADVLFGSSNADVFSGEGGDDYIDGGLGDDTVFMYGSRSQYVLAKTQDGGFTLTDSVMGRDAADSVYQVETLQFSDRTVDLTMGLHAEGLAAADIKTLEELYVGFFDRVPEAEGLAYWLDQLKAGVTLTAVANQFYSAGVQFGVYQSGMTNQEFIREVYENVLGRPPGALPTDAEVDYWNQRLVNGADTKGSMVLTMLHDVHAYFEHDPTYGFVAALLNNKAAVADYYALQQGLSMNVQADNIAFGAALADLITPTDTTAAISFIGVNTFSVL